MCAAQKLQKIEFGPRVTLAPRPETAEERPRKYVLYLM
jgi:hypothetical protein